MSIYFLTVDSPLYINASLLFFQVYQYHNQRKFQGILFLTKPLSSCAKHKHFQRIMFQKVSHLNINRYSPSMQHYRSPGFVRYIEMFIFSSDFTIHQLVNQKKKVICTKDNIDDLHSQIFHLMAYQEGWPNYIFSIKKCLSIQEFS